MAEWAARRRQRFGWLVLSVLAATAVARADEKGAAGAPPARIWYRSSAGCPDGEAFLARLAGRAQGAALAQVGDRIDFVVTLGRDGDTSFGKLERQTEGSTIAVREIQSENCEDVADVIALTLALALDRSSGGTATTASAAPATEATPAPPATAASPTPQRPPVPPPARPATEARPPARRTTWVGAQVGAFTRLVSSPGATAGVFFEVAPRTFPLRGASARATVFGARAKEDDPPPYLLSVVAGRLDACPTDLLGSALHLRPCLALDLGTVRVRGEGPHGRSDQGIWVAAAAKLRFQWDASPRVSLEAEGGAFVPLMRYTVDAAGADGGGNGLDRVAPVVALGAALAVP